MVQFRVLELTLSFSSHFTLPELTLYVTDLHEIKRNIYVLKIL